MTKIKQETKWLYLSHILDDNTPIYGGGNGFFHEAEKSLANGDSCNKQKWNLSNHVGTHIDCPRHFCEGTTIDFYPASFWIFKRISLIDLSALVVPEQIVTWSDIKYHLPEDDVEFLLVKTGFTKFRNNEIFWQKNPGFAPDLAEKLKFSFPSLRLFGFDAISLTSYSDKPMGHKAHRAFLDSVKPILLLEDMDLTAVSTNTDFRQITVSPLIVKGSDASPCTVFAEVYEL